jgi:hypothetical protein
MTTSWNDLSEEIIIYIMNFFLEPMDFFHLGATSKTMFHLCWKHRWTRTKRFYSLLHFIPLLSEEDYQTFIEPIPTNFISNSIIQMALHTANQIKNHQNHQDYAFQNYLKHQFLFYIFSQHLSSITINHNQSDHKDDLLHLFEKLHFDHQKEYNEWIDQFGSEKWIVSFEDFYMRMILCRHPLDPTKYESFRDFVCNQRNHQMVSLYRWLVLLDQFGPSIEHFILHFYTFPIVLPSKTNSNQIEKYLESNGLTNCYIIRNSETYPEQLAISYISKETFGKVRHRRKPCGMSFDLFIHRHFATMKPIMIVE